MDRAARGRGEAVSARLEAMIEAQAVALRSLTAQVEALRQVVDVHGARLDKAAAWSVNADRVLDEVVADGGLTDLVAFDLCGWHAVLAESIPEFRKRHPLDPYEDRIRRAEARAAANGGKPSPFDRADDPAAYGFDALTLVGPSSDGEADRGHQPA